MQKKHLDATRAFQLSILMHSSKLVIAQAEQDKLLHLEDLSVKAMIANASHDSWAEAKIIK